MNRYKITYTYTDYDESIHGKRIRCTDVYEAETAQEAVDSCRADFYLVDQLSIEEVSKWSDLGYYLPVFDNSWY